MRPAGAAERRALVVRPVVLRLGVVQHLHVLGKTHRKLRHLRNLRKIATAVSKRASSPQQPARARAS